ncbi:MAG: hypothetical protein WC346_11945 [Methanogenium sp.]|jgi:hypothetical protein
METIGIFVGRMQPCTILHQKIINSMKEDKTYIFIVEGARSSMEKKNFLTFQDRVQLLSVTNPKAKVLYSKHGYLPDIIEQNRLAKKGDIVRVYAGSDRIDGYNKQFEGKDIDYQYEGKEIPRQAEDVSATKVRQALLHNDYGTYKRMIARGLDNEKYFSWLKMKITNKMVSEEYYV